MEMMDCTMLDVNELKKIFSVKLMNTASLDEAFTKAVWEAYKKGVEDGKSKECVNGSGEPDLRRSRV
ncbi:MAG: hypothetical protein NTW48_09915 [Chloroflexi bacterium]|nr:hypothetical protein [Chloroflexota bacterium]